MNKTNLNRGVQLVVKHLPAGQTGDNTCNFMFNI
jgi:hypothetical protein